MPDVDEESVDIYDGLEINPSSNAGKRYFCFGLVQNDSLSNIKCMKNNLSFFFYYRKVLSKCFPAERVNGSL